MIKAKRIAAAFLALMLMISVMPGATANAASTSTAATNEILVYNYLVGTMGLNTAAACGLLANVKEESGFITTRPGDGNTSFGLFQWHRNRKSELLAYCKANGLNANTVEGQMRYMEYDLKKNRKKTYNYIKSVPNTALGAYNAAHYWCMYYEIPANKEAKSNKRGNLARNTYWPKYKNFNGKTIEVDDMSNPENYVVNFTRTLSAANKTNGSDTLYMQVCLKKLGYSISTDSKFGNGTASVVKKFQSAHGLTADGVINRETWDAIESAALGYTLVSGGTYITTQPSRVTAHAGESVTFKVTARGSGLTYQWYYKKASMSEWSKWEGRSTSSFSAKAIESWNGMTVRCEVTDESGAVVCSDSAKVSVYPKFSITEHPKNITGATGKSVKFHAAAEGSGLSAQWYYKKPGQSSWSKWVGHATASFTIALNASWNGMQVRCRFTDASGKTLDTNSATVKVGGNVTITTQPADITGKVGQSATFKVAASGSGLSYQWYYKKPGQTSWSKWAGHATASFKIALNETWDGMLVRCAVSSGGNTVTSESAKVTVTSTQSVRITTQPADIDGVVGERATFKVAASGSGLSYQWYYKKPGQSSWSKWAGHTTASFTIALNETWHGMQVRCAVTSGSVTVTSDSASVKVRSDEAIEISKQPQSVSVAVGDSVSFDVEATGSGLSYQWYIMKSDASSWSVWDGKTGASVSDTADESWNGMKVRCQIKDSCGAWVTSSTATVTLSDSTGSAE